MKLIVHAGTHKTGTTSIQRALKENREWLVDRGFYYPFGVGPYKHSNVPHHKFAHHLTGVIEEEQRQAESFAEEALASAGAAHTIIISCEALYRHVSGYNSWDQYTELEDYWERRADYVRRIGSAFPNLDARVILFFREKDEFVRSFLRDISKGRWPIDEAAMESFVAQRPHLLDYDRQRQIFESNLGPVTVIQYEDALDRGGAVSEFFRVLGCDLPPDLNELWERKDGELPSFKKAVQS